MIVSPTAPTVCAPTRRYRYAMSEAKIQRWLAEGRGLGERESYKPWFTVADVPSRGKSTRVCGEERFGHRNMHFLSSNEWYAALHLWFDETCVDIKEQYPFRDRMQTLDVAIRLGIKHPEDVLFRVPLVLTSDIVATFLVDGRTRKKAIAVKQADALVNERTRDKLALEEEVAHQNGFAWDKWLSTELRTAYGDNLERLHGYDRSLRVTPAQTDLLLTLFLRYPSAPANKACLECDRACNAPAGTFLGILKALVATKRVTTDLSLANYEEQPCAAFLPLRELASRARHLRRYVSVATEPLYPPNLARMPTGPTSPNPYRARGYLCR